MLSNTFQTFESDLKVFFDASCEYLFYDHLTGLTDNSCSSPSSFDPILSLSSCLVSLRAFYNESGTKEKAALIAYLRNQRNLPSSPFQYTPQVLPPLHMETSTFKIIPNLISLRRGSVSAECIPEPLNQESFIIQPEQPSSSFIKSKESIELIQNSISSNILFRDLDATQFGDIISFMFKRLTTSDEIIIQQGDSGDYFYVIERGAFEVWVDGELRNTLHPGLSFGELALLYNSPRAATIISRMNDGLLWAIDRITFRKIVINHNYMKKKKYENFLKNVALFSSLTSLELSRLSDCVKEVVFVPHQVVIREGDPGDSFYIIAEGHAQVSIKGIQQSILHTGDYFGEMALINASPRAATIVAMDTLLRTLRLNAETFNRLLGPSIEVMKRNMSLYRKLV